ncbi:unnamed protein product [Brassica rapa subsp. narinosa]|uniref:Uncharacterized protein n=1 Tax=Brassica campestris TaxID=3711 RepID=A0A3P5YJ53_BRACM|nr:unnamed protein product [Brassica rapa]
MAESESHTKWSKRHQLGTGTASTTSVTTAPLSTIIPPPYCNNSHDPVTPSSTSAPPPIHSDDGHFDVAPENSGHVPTAS